MRALRAVRVTLWALDIECADWDTFVLGAACSSDGRTEAFRTLRQMADWYVGLPASDLVIAHNGGRYDFLCLLDALPPSPEHPWRGSLAGSALVSLRLKGCAELRDSFRLVMQSLADWTGAKGDVGLPCLCGEDCGGYCAIHRGLPRRALERVLEYCVQDCKALLVAYLTTVARLEADGLSVRDERGQIRRTCGAVAWATAYAMCPDLARDGPPLDWEEYDDEIAAAYGGSVGCQITAAPRVLGFDVNSLYPYCLTQEVPVGRPRYVHRPRDAARAYAQGRPGIYQARVRCEPGMFPLVPHRALDGDMVWSTGTVEGSWTTLELDKAREYGARVEVESAMVWPRLRAVYEPFMRRMWELRDAARARGDEAYREVIKRIANSETGKTGQGGDSETLHVIDERTETPQEDWRYLGGHGTVSAWCSTHRRIPDCARPIHYAWLTSRGRGVLMDGLQALGRHAAYWDTDGIKSTRRLPERMVGGDLGQWKEEKPLAPWYCAGPKLYCGGLEGAADEPDHRDRWYVRAKGVPRAHEGTFRALCQGITVVRESGVEGVRSAYGREGGRAFRRKRVQRGMRRDRALCGTRWIRSDGTTVPLHREESGEYRWPGAAARPEALLDFL